MTPSRLSLSVCLSVAMLAVVLAVGPTSAGSSNQQVQIVAPEDGCVADVGEVLQVLLVVSNQLDISTVAVMCDDRGIGMTSSAPYSVSWDTVGLPGGKHVLRAYAYLRSGEKVGAEPVTVTLSAPKAATAAARLSAQSPEQPGPVVLREGSPVLLQTTEKLESGRVPEGSTVRYKVIRDIVGPQGEVLITYGDFAQGKVTRSRRRGMFGKAGQLEFTVETVEAADGTAIPLRASQELGGKSNKNAVIISTLLLSVFSVFIHGKDVEIPAGTEITAYVDHDTTIRAPRPRSSGGVIQGEPLEEVVIAAPTEGQQFTLGEEVTIDVNVTPRDKFGLLTIFCNGNKIAEQAKELVPVRWRPRRIPAGSYRLEAEVQFTNGRVVRSAPVSVTLVEAQ